ncbi:hypothetical protein C450_20246 [Halococcus salifodinae DSM 8989]|uniref:Uncharacterized protein n=1 Tax=Halococcus salifodinae DSM 8989 TaxID=1227456 RepID=M0MUJ7_9EURY|nr:hypothetical protein C450_20246 [Halococcus salifodinae DSM 8989]
MLLHYPNVAQITQALRQLLKIEELLTPGLCVADSESYSLENILDKDFEFAFILDDDWTHRPLEIVPNFLDWIEMWRSRR